MTPILVPLSASNAAQIAKRDEIALFVLKTLMDQDDTDEESQLRGADYRAYCDVYAESAYEMADAMMRARARTPDFDGDSDGDGEDNTIPPV